MSTIRKKPFIETVVGSLSGDNLASLRYLIDTPTTNTKYSLKSLPSEYGVYGANFEMNDGKIYTSIFIYTSDYKVLIAHHRFQDVLLFQIVDGEVVKVNEYCDINELRRVCADAPVSPENLITCRVESGTITTWSALATPVGDYEYHGTFTVSNVFENSVIELINNNLVDFSTYGYAIGDSSWSSGTLTVDVYAQSDPDASKTFSLKIERYE